jgi:hypothetical protein
VTADFFPEHERVAVNTTNTAMMRRLTRPRGNFDLKFSLNFDLAIPCRRVIIGGRVTNLSGKPKLRSILTRGCSPALLVAGQSPMKDICFQQDAFAEVDRPHAAAKTPSMQRSWSES